MRLPAAVGPLTAAVRRLLLDDTWTDADHEALASFADQVVEPLHDLDFQLVLTCCNELHYRGFSDVDDDREWSPAVFAAHRVLEARFATAVREVVPRPCRDVLDLPVHEGLRKIVADAEDGPALSSFLLKRATAQQFRAFLVQRSLYHLKEADPHSWIIPRLGGDAKAALISIQMDEYGNGRAPFMHSSLFARVMRGLGLDDTYGAYWDHVLPETHATVNLMTMLGLHRQHRGAVVGHLAALEMTSTEPNRRYANGLRRLGFGPDTTAFFDEHVEADAVHEQIAAVDLCGSLVRGEPALHADILWGAAACLAIDALAGQALLDQLGATASLVEAS